MENQITFESARTRTFRLTWGQESTRRALARIGPENLHVNPRFYIELPPDRNVSQVIAYLRHMMIKYEALRTTIDLTASGEYLQRVHGAGSIPLITQELTDFQGAQAARVFLESLATTSFSTDQVPIHLGVLNERGKPRFLVAVISHLLVDGWGLGLLRDQLAASTWAARVPKPDLSQPVDRARFEDGPIGRSISNRSIARWRRAVDRRPVAVLGKRRSPDNPRFCEVTYRPALFSNKLAAKSEAIGVSKPAVLVTALARALGLWSGSNHFAALVEVSNRFNQEMQESLGTYNQLAPVSCDTGGEFSDAGRMMHTSLLLAYLTGQYNPRDHEQMLADMGLDAAGFGDYEVMINIPSGQTTATPSALPPDEQEFCWGPGRDYEIIPFFVKITGINDHTEIFARVDTTYVSRSEVEPLLRAVEHQLRLD